MKSKITTKHALFSSVMSLFLCVAMLIGSTFAWFTDEASTKVNKIEAGTLKVELLDEIGNPLSDTQALNWKTTDTTVLWEPNCTYDLDSFQIKNAGNLALKYSVVLKAGIIDETADGKTLLDVIDWTINGEPADIKASLANGVTIISDEILHADETATISVKGHMQSSAGNDYQGLKIDDFGITVLATQASYENDSNGNTYDDSATYPDVAYVTVGSSEELKDAVNNATNASGESTNKIAANLGDGTYTLYNATNKTKNATLILTGNGADKTTFTAGNMAISDANGEGSADYSYENSDVSFKNMTVNVGTGNYKGFIRAKSLYFENCTIVGRGSYWGVGKVVFKNCIFAANSNDYNLWTYSGTDFVFENCTFNTDCGKFVNAYKEQRVDAKLTFTDCKFINTGSADKPAVCLKSYTGIAWDVTFTNCTTQNANVDSTTGSNLYSIESNMNADTRVIINGTVVWQNGATV